MSLLLQRKYFITQTVLRCVVCCEHEVSHSWCDDPSQVDSLTERVEELKQDKKRLVEEYEAKLSKVQKCCRGHAVKRLLQMSKNTSNYCKNAP